MHILCRQIVFFTVVLFAGCERWEYSPNQRFSNKTPVNLNARNLEALSNTVPDDTVRFILSGDTQRGYGEAEDFVKKANTMKGIDFVVIAGDISDFGLLQEMEWVAEIYEELKVPYVAVIGNHDMAANGTSIFRQVFGELNYSFAYGGYKFICLNTNSREVNFDGSLPDVNWLQDQLKPAAGINGQVVISHVSPFSGDFDRKLEMPFVTALENAGNCLGSLHAHDHNAGQYRPYNNSIPFIVASAILKRQFTLVEIIDGKLEAREMEY